MKDTNYANDLKNTKIGESNVVLNTYDNFFEREREVYSFMSIGIFQDNACLCIHYIRIHHTPKKHQQKKSI